MRIPTRDILGLLMLIACLSGSADFAKASSAWPNEPTGWSTLVDCPFSGSICNLLNVYNTAAFAEDSSAPSSPSGVFDTYMAAYSNHGNGKWFYVIPNGTRELYIGTWWKTNPEFQGTLNNSNKLFVQKGISGNGYLLWYGPQDKPKIVHWHIASVLNNCHVSGYVGDCPGAGSLWPNSGGNGSIAAGSGWHRLEVYQKASTTATSRDGAVRWWVDGQLVGNYSNLNYMPDGFGEYTITHTWDGSGDTQAPNRDITRAWHHYWDSLHISAGSGGSPADQPPGPPSAPRLIDVTVR